MIIGLTGGTGAGKGIVAKVFENKGYVIIDLDKTYAGVISKGSDCLLEIADRFGKNFILPDGTLDRKALGKLVFSNAEKLEILNSITHKYVKIAMQREIEAAKGNDIVIDAPLLFSAGLDKMCDKIVCVVAEDSVRLGRIVERDNLDLDTARGRISTQMTNDEYIKRSDFVIENNGDIDAVEMSAIKLAEELKGFK